MLPVEDPPNAPPDIFRERFESCFRDHYARLLAFTIRRVGRREAAEEVVADIYAVAWRRRDRIPESSLPWLYGIATNLIADQYRSSRRRQDLGLRLAHEARGGADGSDPADAVARRDTFAIAFARLEEHEREVLRLIAWDGLDVPEAAQILGCSRGAFRVRLHRARRKLARQLDATKAIDGKSQATIPRPTEEAR
jgi:RNA polymerase sigma-70 factor (ECF subfamily)